MRTIGISLKYCIIVPNQAPNNALGCVSADLHTCILVDSAYGSEGHSRLDATTVSSVYDCLIGTRAGLTSPSIISVAGYLATDKSLYVFG